MCICTFTRQFLNSSSRSVGGQEKRMRDTAGSALLIRHLSLFYNSCLHTVPNHQLSIGEEAEENRPRNQWMEIKTRRSPEWLGYLSERSQKLFHWGLKVFVSLNMTSFIYCSIKYHIFLLQMYRLRGTNDELSELLDSLKRENKALQGLFLRVGFQSVKKSYLNR